MNKDKLAAIIITVLIVAYYVAYFVFLIIFLPLILKIILGIVPLALAIGMIKTLMDRIHEIEKGENNDISNY